MSSTPKEGGDRPLRESTANLPLGSAPKTPETETLGAPATAPAGSPAAAPAQPPAAPAYTAPPRPEMPKPLPRPAPLPPAFAWAALASYLPAYLYVRYILFIGVYAGWGLPLFAALFIGGVEVFAAAVHRQGSRESVFWAVCWALLSLCMVLYGAQPGGLSLWQALAWHAFAIWYTLARCGMLAAGRSGILIWLDALAGTVTLPFGNFFLRIQALWQGICGLVRRRVRPTAGGKKRLLTAAVSIALAYSLCAVVWGQLAAADEHFAKLGTLLFDWLRYLPVLEPGPWLLYLILSLPVGAWLYSLAAGGLKRREAPITAKGFYAWLAPLQKLPPFTVYLTLGALCGVYTLFFAVQAYTFAGAAFALGRLALSGTQASGFAVNGFWELCRVLLLNFAVLAGLRFLGPQLRQKRPVKVLCAVFCSFGLGFVGLAAAKLGAYIHLYAYTPRRVISGWFLCVLAVWAVLALLWVLGVKVPLGHARLGLFIFAAAFIVLASVNMQHRIVHANIGRWAAGTDAELDIDTLRACGVGPWGHESGREGEQALYAGWLLEAGWFEGRSAADISHLYSVDLDAVERSGPRIAGVYLGADTTLRLHFTGGICTGAELVPVSASASTD